jgi:hypothetical protein
MDYSTFTHQDAAALESLRARGFAVCVFYPGDVEREALGHIEAAMDHAALSFDYDEFCNPDGTPCGTPIVYNDELAADIYEEGGQSAVIDAARAGVLRVDTWGPCEPCDDDQSPIADGCCLVCGTVCK